MRWINKVLTTSDCLDCLSVLASGIDLADPQPTMAVPVTYFRKSHRPLDVNLYRIHERDWRVMVG